ncbi:MAG: 3-phosphoshikimate 1-carboxyvinyltransferase [Myxococcota bacterium]
MSTIVARASGPLRGECRVPGDKSILHRAVIVASLAVGESLIEGFSGGEDNLRTIEALRAMGAAIDVAGHSIRARGAGFDGLRPAGRIDCGNSGTSMRLLAGLCAAQRGVTILDGDESLRRRPMRRVAQPLERMGARVGGRASAAGEILPPIEVRGGALHGIDETLAVASAQVKSALLLAALHAEGVTCLHEPTRSRDHTERMLTLAGAPLRVDENAAIVLDPSGWDHRLRPLDLTIPGDFSSAAFVVAAALLVPGSDVVVRDVGVNPTRTGALDALRAMGAAIDLEDVREAASARPTGRAGGEPVADLRVRGSALHACTIAGELTVRALDEIPILAIVASQAEGTTVIRDASELRRKESDRLAAMARALRRLGCEVEEAPDGLVIAGPCALAGGDFDVTDVGLDHRVAMSLAIAGLVARAPVRLAGAGTIATSFPGFASTLAALGAPIAASLRTG